MFPFDRSPLTVARAMLTGAGLTLVASASAQTTLRDYQAGLAAVDAGDVAAAVEIWQGLITADAADRPQAEYALALLYETGRAVAWDEARAASLYEASGLPEALTNLGLMYAEGRGVDYDPARAAELWQEAADQGHSFASFNLGLAYYGGNGVPKNAVRALELIYDAGEGGLAEAQWAVCQFYERGVGVAVDYGVAAQWCARAAEQGHLQAIQAVQRLATATPPTDNPDDVDLSEPAPVSEVAAVPEAEPQPDPAPSSAGVDGPAAADPTMEFATELPTTPVETVVEADSARDNTPPTPLDPLLLLGSEFDEFADLLAPVDEHTIPNLTEPRPSAGELSEAADAIAALIDSAAAPQPDLPAVNGAAEAGLLRVHSEERGARISLQELIDGTELAADSDPATTLPPLPNNRPALTYAIPPIVEGPVYAVWLGSGETADEAEALYADAVRAAPDVLSLMEAAYQNDRLPADLTGASSDQEIVRLLLGPLPGEGYAWQICNLLKQKRGSTFCLPVEVEG